MNPPPSADGAATKSRQFLLIPSGVLPHFFHLASGAVSAAHAFSAEDGAGHGRPGAETQRAFIPSAAAATDAAGRTVERVPQRQSAPDQFRGGGPDVGVSLGAAAAALGAAFQRGRSVERGVGRDSADGEAFGQTVQFVVEGLRQSDAVTTLLLVHLVQRGRMTLAVQVLRRSRGGLSGRKISRNG